MKISAFMLRWGLAGLSLLLTFPAYGQSSTIKQTLRGTIYDQSTRQPLAGAKVQLPETSPIKGAISDEEGNFVIEGIPVGRYALTISYIGYTTQVKNSILLTSGQETVLEVGMVEQPIEGEVVTIEADQRKVTNEAAVVSARSFSVEELRRIPGGIDDPARMAAKFPGISPKGSVLLNELNVRGNGARAVIWRLEGVDIYNPNHFGLLGGSGGSITLFSQQLLANTDFFSGAFPADYGNALGGVFDARFRNGNTQKRQHAIQVGFLGIDAATEGPFTKKGNSSYLVNYRFSTTGLIDQFLNIGAIPTFQDLSFKLHFELPNSGTLNFFGIGGISLIEFRPVLDTLQWEDRAAANFGRINRSITGTTGLTYSQPVGEKSFIQSTLIGTGIRMFSERYYQNRDLVTADTTRKSLDKEFRLTWSTFLNHKFGPRHTHRTGLMVHGLSTDVFFVEGSETGAGSGIGNALEDTLRIGNGRSMMVQAYTRSQFTLSPNWKLNAGLHFMYFAQTGEVSVEPRIGLRYQIGPRQSLSLGYGLHSQMEPFFTYIVERRNAQGIMEAYNSDLRFNKAHHLVLGYRLQVNERLRLGLEAYYQAQFNLVVGEDFPVSRVAALDFTFETLNLNNGGSGRNLGIEFAMERILADGYYFLVNGSLFDATYTANDGVVRPSMFNAQIVGNGVIGKEWEVGRKKGKANLLNVNLSATYSGPQYFTPPDLEFSLATGFYQTDFANPNSFRQDPLVFVDASIVYQRNRPKRSSQLALQVKNLLNQRPLLSLTFDRENEELDEFFGTGLFPILIWKIQF